MTGYVSEVDLQRLLDGGVHVVLHRVRHPLPQSATPYPSQRPPTPVSHPLPQSATPYPSQPPPTPLSSPSLTGHASEVDLQRLLDGGVDVVLHRVLAEEQLDGERATGDAVHRHVAEELRELVGVHRRRRDDQLQVLAARDHLRGGASGGGQRESSAGVECGVNCRDQLQGRMCGRAGVSGGQMRGRQGSTVGVH